MTPSTRLSDYRDAQVRLGCKACLHEREVSARSLARLIGWQTRIAAAIPRMRCSACGARSAHVLVFYPQRPRGWLANPS